MGRQLRWDRLRHPIAKAWQVNAREQGFTTAQNDGRQSQVDLVDRPCEQVLTDRGNSAADLHVQFARGGLGLGERRRQEIGLLLVVTFDHDPAAGLDDRLELFGGALWWTDF